MCVSLELFFLVSDSGSSSPSSGGSPATGRKQGPPTAPKPGMTPSKTFLTRLEREPTLCKLKLENFMKHYVSGLNITSQTQIATFT